MSDKNKEAKAPGGIYAIEDKAMLLEMLQLLESGEPCKTMDEFAKFVFRDIDFAPNSVRHDAPKTTRYVVCGMAYGCAYDIEGDRGMASPIDSAEALASYPSSGGYPLFVLDKQTQTLYDIEPNLYVWEPFDKESEEHPSGIFDAMNDMDSHGISDVLQDAMKHSVPCNSRESFIERVFIARSIGGDDDNRYMTIFCPMEFRHDAVYGDSAVPSFIDAARAHVKALATHGLTIHVWDSKFKIRYTFEPNSYIWPKVNCRDEGPFEEQSSDISSFIEDMCAVGPEESVEKVELVHHWNAWRISKGYKKMGEAVFGKLLSSAVMRLETERRRIGNGRKQVYTGIGLVPEKVVEYAQEYGGLEVWKDLVQSLSGSTHGHGDALGLAAVGCMRFIEDRLSS